MPLFNTEVLLEKLQQHHDTLKKKNKDFLND